MRKQFKTLQDYHDNDQTIQFQKFSGDHFRVGHLKEVSSDVRFTSTERNGIVVDLSGTRRHLTQMDGKTDETATRKDDVCLIPQGLEARFAWEVINAPQHSIIVEFDNQSFSAYLPQFESDRISGGHLLPTIHAQRPNLRFLAGMLQQELDPTFRRGRLFSDSVMRLVLIEVGASHWSVPLLPLKQPQGGDARIRRAIDFIETHFAEDISLADIARASGLSLTQLTSLFRTHTGTTPYSCLIDRRVRRAEELLEKTDIPIAQIAVETGFADQQHMTRVCRKRLRKTPMQVRKSQFFTSN